MKLHNIISIILSIIFIIIISLGFFFSKGLFGLLFYFVCVLSLVLTAKLFMRILSLSYSKSLAIAIPFSIIFGLTFYLVFSPSPPPLNFIPPIIPNITNITIPELNGTEIEVPFYQRLVLLVQYDELICPDLAVNHTRGNVSEIVPIEKVKNINQSLYFAKLGRYNTNEPNNQVIFSFVNFSDCVPEYRLITNNEFIILLLELGVPLSDEAQNKTIHLNNETALIDNNNSGEYEEESLFRPREIDFKATYY